MRSNYIMAENKSPDGHNHVVKDPIPEIEVIFSGNPDESEFWDAYLQLCIKQLRKQINEKCPHNRKK